MDEQPTKVLTLQDALATVARHRYMIDLISANMDALIRQVKEGEAYKTFELQRQQHADLLSLSETQAKQLLLDAYRADGKKSRPGGMVKTFTKTAIVYDGQTAREWAEKAMPALLILDVKKFEKYAEARKDVLPLEFVTFEVTTEDKAQLAADLSAFIEKE